MPALSFLWASLYWVTGFCASGSYTAFLFGLAWLVEHGDRAWNRWSRSSTQPNVVTTSSEPQQEASSTEEEEHHHGNEEMHPPAEEEEAGDDHEMTTEPLLVVQTPEAAEEARGIATLQSLLYGLALAALGVTGFFVPVNVLGGPCGGYFGNSAAQQSQQEDQWKANLTSLPSAMHDWATDDYYATPDDEQQSFCYLANLGVTLFRGRRYSFSSRYSSHQDMLYAVQSSDPPVAYKDIVNPRFFVNLEDQMACVAQDPDTSTVARQLPFLPSGIGKSPSSLVCFEQDDSSVADVWNWSGPIGSHRRKDVVDTSLSQEEEQAKKEDTKSTQLVIRRPTYPSDFVNIQRNWIYSMKAWNQTLFFKQQPPISSRQSSGLVVLSVNPLTSSSLMVQSHSYVQSSSEDSSCTSSNMKLGKQQQALGILFLVALPMWISSLWIWKLKQHVASMGFAAFGSLTLVFASIYAMVDPTMTQSEKVYQWWFLGSGLVVGLLSIRALLLYGGIPSGPGTPPRPRLIVPGPFHWCANAACLAYVTGLLMIYDLWDYEGDTWRNWFLLTLTGSVPVAMGGAAVNSLFLLLVSATGFFADAVRLSFYVADRANEDYMVPIVFVVLAVSGVLLGWIGMILSKQRHRIQEQVTAGFVLIDNLVLHIYRYCCDKAQTPVEAENDEGHAQDEESGGEESDDGRALEDIGSSE